MTAPAGEGTLALDPRLRARRREIQRHQGRRRLRRLQAAMGLAALGAGAWGLALSPLADVDRVLVEGANRSGTDAVEDATGIHRGEALATLDIGQAGAGVEGLPWVATATVTRSWPDSVVVVVTERRPVAVVTTADGSRVAVDGQGRQLAVVDDSAFPELVGISGLAPDADPGATLGLEAAAPLELAGLLPRAVPGLRSELAVTGGELEARVLGRAGEEVLVRFGDGDRLADKVTALAALVGAGVLGEGPGLLEVDLRVPDAPVLTRTGG